MRLRCLLILLFLPGLVAVGRVGDTEPELTARYGAVTSRQPARKSVKGQLLIYGERLGFRFEFWTVSAVITAGRCEEIEYTLTGKWTEPHFRRLLEINGGWTEWTEQKTRNPDNHRAWQRHDQATADWGLSGFTVREAAKQKP